MSDVTQSDPALGSSVAALLSSVLRLQLAERRIEGRIGAEHGLSQSDVLALALLIRNERQTVGQIASELALNPGSASALVTRLSRAGLVQRAVNGADRRSVLIEVTLAGQALVGGIRDDCAAAIWAAGAQTTPQCVQTAADVIGDPARHLELGVEPAGGGQETTSPRH